MCLSTKKGGEQVKKSEQIDIEETIKILKQLDLKSLLILDSGARMLKARQDMELDKNRQGSIA